jgi:glutathione peroxidase
MTIYDYEIVDGGGNPKMLAEYQGKVILIVNTASKCGFTPQYKGLQKLYEDYHEQGLEVLAFPCDQFAHQEPGSNEEIQTFCAMNYGVSFPVMAKIEVNGKNAHPLYKFLRKEKKGGIFGNVIKWNFTKFLVDKEGNVVERFSPDTDPEKLRPDIEALLK